MKIIIATIYTFISVNIYSQTLDSCGLDNYGKVTRQEAIYLNNYLKDQLKGFDFKDKRIIFVSPYDGGIWGPGVGSKSDYFTNIKIKEVEFSDTNIVADNRRIATTLFILNQDEKIQSGGYDAMLTYWVKYLSKHRRKVIIRKIKTNE